MTTLKEKISAKFVFTERQIGMKLEKELSKWADWSRLDEKEKEETLEDHMNIHRWQHNQLKNEVLPILLECAEALELVSKGHTIAKINFDYFHEDSKEEGMIKNEILVTPQTEQARQALERLRKWSESENIF